METEATVQHKLTVEWINYDDVPKEATDIGSLGGWFSKGMRWEDYIEDMPQQYSLYYEAIRESVLMNDLKITGNYHQDKPKGVPLFSDGVVLTASYRAWGDLMAAIWSTSEGKDYSYIDFYY